MDPHTPPHETDPSGSSAASLDRRLSTIAEQLADPAAPWRESARHATRTITQMDHAASLLGDLARECREEHARVHAEGDVPTPAQGLALARLLRRAFASCTDPSRASARIGLVDRAEGVLQVYTGCGHATVLLDREGRVRPRGRSSPS